MKKIRKRTERTSAETFYQFFIEMKTQRFCGVIKIKPKKHLSLWLRTHRIMQKKTANDFPVTKQDCLSMREHMKTIPNSSFVDFLRCTQTAEAIVSMPHVIRIESNYRQTPDGINELENISHSYFSVDSHRGYATFCAKCNMYALSPFKDPNQKYS